MYILIIVQTLILHTKQSSKPIWDTMYEIIFIPKLFHKTR